ncbi:hypothetical protein TCAL_08140 [Tigriopus californicus]|uniref:Uncharacterized protein n=1 Tax=Tigriopus californicus TaxID=6832 RepID=A0A553PLM6_TIGCA|nr:C-signal-like [Tigriopus californicus]TRY78584.1 hypothetical protein TCAL_08140 [Tigriopus californicus]|eukprot:TCALIF_08140-PA protein Name:"Similar to SPCC663.06c Uncharacterized oxidoreductase C663.06c (Schizosaccharomyces pombe (strain 972 / ATCC 24843))" AED:0.11 eAED:0.11 QI:0/-1/0/1/-1/1/1/0/238
MGPSKVVLITGCSRGIGLGFVRYFVKHNWKVLATCRTPHEAVELKKVLQDHNQTEIIQCDVSFDDSIEACYQSVLTLGITHLDLLINNAGTSNDKHPFENPSRMKRDEFHRILDVNATGLAMVTNRFIPLLQAAADPLVVNIGSMFGTVSMVDVLTCASYRCSKSCLNMLTSLYALEFSDIGFLALHPGWVQTDLGGKNPKPPLTVAESVGKMSEVIAAFDKTKSGQFWSLDGYQLDP